MSKDDHEDPCGESEQRSETYEVGYGKPPKATRFGVRAQPVNRRGDKQRSPDIAALLERPIEASIGGKLKKIHPHEAMLHGLFKRVVTGEIRAIKLFLDECKRANLLDSPPQFANPIIEIPNDIPMPLAVRLVKHGGPPPWDADLFAQFKSEYERDVAAIEQLKQQAKSVDRSAVDQSASAL